LILVKHGTVWRACRLPGHLDRIGLIEDAERALPGLHFCANYRGGVSLGDCIRSAARTVGRLT
jgi:protoporphyrinogen oxidase